MSETTRREILKNIAMSVTLGGMAAEAAQHVHEHVSESKKNNQPYAPKLFNAHEYKTVTRLAELIFPADDQSGSAVEAGAPGFIDLIGYNNEDLATTLVGGLQWLDIVMTKKLGVAFIDATPDEQLAMMDVIAYRKNQTPENGPGIYFFDWIRRLTADAYYTSPIGVKDLGYLGNKGMTVFQVPQASIEYAVKRSGL